MMIFLFIIFFALLGAINSQSGKVTPIGRTPILLSSNNVDEISSYTFTFIIDTPTIAGDYLVISFPQSQYGHLTAGTYVAYLHPEAFIPQQTTLQCYFTTDGEFIITLIELNNGLYNPHSITILDIKNPSTVGGTGKFEVQTRRGLANVLDLNGAFNQVGLVAAPTALTATVSIIANSMINLNGTYEVTIDTTKTIPQQGSLLLTFPSKSTIFSDYTCSVVPSASACSRLNAQTIKITNFTADVTGTVTVTLTQILNIDYADSAGNLKIQTWTSSVNTILEQVTIPLTAAEAGTISAATTSYTNFFQTGMILVPNDYVSYEISFRTINPVPVGGSVKVTLPMNMDYCVPYLGFNDVSESSTATCTISGNEATIQSFSSLSSNQLLTVMIRATNPSTTGATTSVLIGTYKDSASTQLIDHLTAGLSFTISDTLTKMKSLSLSLSNTNGLEKAVWTINWQSVNQLTSINVGTFAITMPSGFSFDGTPSCQLQPSGSIAEPVDCTYTGGILTLSTSTFTTSTFSNTADNTLIISGTGGGVFNAKAGDYNILFQLSESGTLVRSQSLIFTIGSAALSGVVVTPFTLDRAKFTLYEVSLNAPEALSAGNHPANIANAQTRIRLEFQTAQGATILFPLDLGRTNDTTSGSTIPCYGADYLRPYQTTASLRCIIYFAAAALSTNPVVIEVFDFASVTSGQKLTLMLPKILNPDSMNTPAQVAVSLLYTQNHITRTYYTTTYTLPTCVLDAVVRSPNNNNGVGGIPTNLAPTFNPNTINRISRGEVKLTPQTGRNLEIGDKLIIKFPLVSKTTPQRYIFDATTTCSIGLTTSQPCLVFPEVGWIVIKSLASAFAANQEYSIMISNVKNPPFALAFQGVLNVITVFTPAGVTRECEEFIYTSFAAFRPGGLSNINVFSSNYEANAVDVEYNWIFVISNPVPAGSILQLTFPPNAYSLNSDPPVIGTVISGLTPADPSVPISFSFVINVVTIKNFAAVSGGTLIRVVTNGVKNPIQATRTTNFAIRTMSTEGFTIDANSIISGVNILQASPTGIIVFNHFYTTPSNGKMFGNYYLSFYPQTSYPKGTTIQVIFPSSDFPESSFLHDTCSISGALTTLQSCKVNSTLRTYTIITDQKLEIEAGMEPLKLFFPHIINFNEELNSGVIQVRALYDGVILDDSGNAEDNRKATTSLASTVLTLEDFSYVPTTEGQSATYQVRIKPKESFSEDTVIQFEFPFEYVSGLGETVNCQVPDLQISTEIPIMCTVSDRTVNITKHKGYTWSSGSTGFVVTIGGIINPNSLPAVNDPIIVFLLTTPTFASEYNNETLIGLTFTPAPEILDVTAFSSSSVYTRTLSDYTFTLVPTMNIAFPSTLTTEFSSEYDLETFSKSSTLAINSGTATSTTPIGNFLIKDLPNAISVGTSFTLQLTNLANPHDIGEKRYPTVFIQNSGVVTVRTYDNLIKPLNFIFSHQGEIVTINDDNPATIYPGQANKYSFKFLTPTTQTLTIQAIPLTPSFVDVKDITVPVGSTSASIWIGVPSTASQKVVYIEWKILGDTINHYWIIRPLEVHIVQGQTEIFVDEIVQVPAGGRTNPCYITLSNSPLNDLKVQLYQRGNIPTYVNVYPSQLTFKKGELKKPFWVSSGRDTKGVVGSILFLINGTNKGAYFMPKRTRSFIISRGETNPPHLLRNSLIGVYENYITVNASTSEPCTIYYFVAPRGTLPPLFQDIKDKKIRYDYYTGEYVVGEYVMDTLSYNYTLNVTGLKPGMDYDSWLFIEDFSGNIESSSFSYQFTTNQDYPRQVAINILQNSLTASDISDLFTNISKIANIDISRLESDLTVLNAKGAGDTTQRFSNPDAFNRREKPSLPFTSPPNVAAGTTQFNFIIFPDLENPFAPSNQQAVKLIENNLNLINAAYAGGNKVNVAYGVKNNQVIPDDIRWDIGTQPTITADYTTITISGLKLNAHGVIHATAFAIPRPAFYSTQESLSSVIRHLKQVETPDNTARNLASSYGQQVCVASEENELDVGCNGEGLPDPDRTRIDYDFFYNPPIPSSYQVARESDGNYFKGDSSAHATVSAGTPTTLTLSGLSEGTKYLVYVSATDGYSKFPERMLDAYIISQEVTTLKHVVLTVGASILSIGLPITILTAILTILM